MDFLDPRKKRAHNIRLMIGYVFAAVAILLGTVILVYSASGYGINTKTGAIIQNSILFTNSQPSGAQIYLNGIDQKTTTGARLILPAGDYSLSLSRSGYRTWQRQFTLSEHRIARYVYPFLFPDKPLVSSLAQYPAVPTFISQSLDRRWLLIRQPDVKTVSFDMYDTTDLTKPPIPLTLPASLLSADGSGQLFPVEWSSNNNNLLIKHAYAGGTEFIVLSRDEPAKSFNVNRLFNITPDAVVLRDKKINQLYIYDAANKTVGIADTNRATVAPPIIKNVLSFKATGADLIVYASDKNAAGKQTQIRIWEKDKSYLLTSLTPGSNYLIDLAQYQGNWYYAAGSDAEERILIYKNPLDGLKNPQVAKASPILALHEPAATSLSFSDNGRFVMAEAGQKFAVYDIETDTPYRYSLSEALAGPVKWMDGYRLIGLSGDKVLVSDYDSTNRQLLTPSVLPQGGLFSKDFKHLLTLRVTGSGSYELADTDMRAGPDLPKNP